MNRIGVLWGLRVIAAVVGYFVAGVLAGRLQWHFIETRIDAEALRVVVDLIGEPLGLNKITSIDSRLQAIERVVDYLSFPWALLGGVLGLIASEWLIGLAQKAPKG
jgi:hypothetical protein